MSCEASSWPKLGWGVGRECHARLRPGQHPRLGLERVCRLRLRYGWAVCVICSLRIVWRKRLVKTSPTADVVEWGKSTWILFIFSWNKIWGVWHSTSTVQFCLIAILGGILLLLLLLDSRTVLPSLTRTFRPSSWHCFASSRRGHLCGNFFAEPSCCMFLPPEACMLLRKFFSCREAREEGRVRSPGFPCWGIGKIVLAWWTVRPLPLISWSRCRTWSCMEFLV